MLKQELLEIEENKKFYSQSDSQFHVISQYYFINICIARIFSC